MSDFIWKISELITEDPDIFNKVILEEVSLQHLKTHLYNHSDETIIAIKNYLDELEVNLQSRFSKKSIKKLINRQVLNRLPAFNDESPGHIFDAIKQRVEYQLKEIGQKDSNFTNQMEVWENYLKKEYNLSESEIKKHAYQLALIDEKSQKTYLEKLKKQSELSEDSILQITSNPTIIAIDHWIGSGRKNVSNLTNGVPTEYHKYLGDDNFHKMWCVQYEKYFDDYTSDNSLYLLIGQDGEGKYLMSLIPPSRGGGIRNIKDDEISGNEAKYFEKTVLPKVMESDEPELIMILGEYFPKAYDSVLSKEIEDIPHWQAAKITRDPKTSPEVLEKLSATRHHDIKSNIASNPNTPPKVLEYLLSSATKHDEYDIRGIVLNNASLPQEILSREVDKILETPNMLFKHRQHIMSAARNENTPAETLVKIIESSKNGALKDFSNVIMKEVARNPSIPLEILLELSDHKDPFIRTAVASNTKTPQEILKKLLEDSSSQVIGALAYNRNSPEEVLIDIINNTTPTNKYFSDDALHNPSLSLESIWELSKNPRKIVALLIARGSWYQIKGKKRDPKMVNKIISNLLHYPDHGVQNYAEEMQKKFNQ